MLQTTAAPLQREAVMADPVWVLHVDCDALRSTATGEYILKELGKPDAEQKLTEFESVFGLDPRKALHSLTLYGPSKAPDDWVLLVYADFDSGRLAMLAGNTQEHEMTQHRKYEIHSWIDEKKPARDGVKPRTYAAIHAGKAVIFGQKQARVADALDVLDAVKPNLATSKQFERLGTGDGFVQGAARKVDLPGADPIAAVIRQSKFASLNIGELQRKLAASLTLEANNSEVAALIASVGRGVVAFLALQKENSQATTLAQALAVHEDGASVVVKLNIAVTDAVGVIKAQAAKKKAG